MIEKKNARLLVVDDDIHLLELLTDTLSAIGYQVKAAAGGVEALQKLQDGGIDLVVTDIKMPDIDGVQLFRRIRRHYPDIPVVFITGVASEEILGAVSADGFLAKPFRISTIERLIEQALNKKDAEHEERMRRVLVVDRNERMREALAEALHDYAYLPFSVADGSDALRELEHGEFDAIIADTQSADMDGEELISAIRNRNPDIPVIATSDVPFPSLTPDGSHGSMVDGLLKRPYRVGEVLRLLDELTSSEPH